MLVPLQAVRGCWSRLCNCVVVVVIDGVVDVAVGGYREVRFGCM